ncbi:hypothetical protein [uncultured Sphingomonas sp.]|uniref:hypothetical protein n=1 Tax=uncultured Sphingomonas sp. TaxID=158754 RepID=UPI0030FCDC31
MICFSMAAFAIGYRRWLHNRHRQQRLRYAEQIDPATGTSGATNRCSDAGTCGPVGRFFVRMSPAAASS